MGCGCTRPREPTGDMDLCMEIKSILWRNQTKPISPLHVNILADAAGHPPKDSTLLSKQDTAVDEHSQDSRVNLSHETKQLQIGQKSTVLQIKCNTSDVQINILNSEEIWNLEKLTSTVNITDNAPTLMVADPIPRLVQTGQVISDTSFPEIDPSPRLVHARQVVSDISSPDNSSFEWGQSPKGKELLNAKEELKRLNTDNKLKDVKISELLAENMTLKEHTSKRKHRRVHSAYALQLQDKASTLREKRVAIRKIARIENRSKSILVSSAPILTRPILERASSSKDPGTELFEVDPQLSDLPSLSFRNTLEEAKVQYAKRKSEKIKKPEGTTLEYCSGLITLD